MKVLFTADLHINLVKKNIPLEWSVSRYYALFSTLLELCNTKSIDLLILGGDIFDKVPTVKEMAMYFDLITSIEVPTIVYAGNHEALKRGETFFSDLKDVSYNLNNNVTVIDEYCTIEGIDFLPYNKLHTLKSIKANSNILCTHVRGEITPYVKPEIDLDLLDKWEVVLAGDLHSYANCQRNILYPGSPCTTSFHRSKVDTGVIVFDTETLEHKFVKLELPQLLRKRVTDPKDMVPTSPDYTVYELEGSIKDLSKANTNDLLDKKIVTKATSATLDFAGMDIDEEIRVYSKEILKLDNSEINTVIKVHNDNIT